MSRLLWPAEQLFVTADTSEAVDAILHPRHQLSFQRGMAGYIGPDVFADSLVYSTSDGNTGWTAFKFGPLGHVAFHHWDSGTPDMLQLDIYGSSLDASRALDDVRQFWVPTGIRALLLRRDAPDAPPQISTLCDQILTRSGRQTGLGPGDHLHLMVDQTMSLPRRTPTGNSLDQGLVELVRRLSMRAMTPPISRTSSDGGNFTYEAIVGITTSHVCLRVRQDDDLVHLSLDIFSCRHFTPSTVHRWLDAKWPTPFARRSLLYNRYPSGTFTQL